MADLVKDLVQNLRRKPASSFYSSGSPLALVQYVSDTVPLRSGPCPSVETVTRTAITFANTPNESVVKITTPDGIVFEIGFEEEGATIDSELGGVVFSEGVIPVILNTAGIAGDALCQAEKAAYLLSQYSVLDAFVKDSSLVVLDRDGNDVKWDTSGAPSASSESISVKIAKPVIPHGYRRGDYWEKCKFMRILDVWVEGQDDTHLNLTLILKADLGKLGDAADNVQFPDDLSSDGKSTDYPYFGDSEEIAWEFEVMNPDSYQRAPICQPHPTNPNALLISERKVSEGGSLRVSRVYREIGPVSEQSQSGYQVTYEDPNGANLSERFPIVTLGIEVLLKDFLPPQCGAACPISGVTACGENAELNFSSLKLIEPAVLEPLNTVYGKLTAVYGRLPGYVTEEISENGRFGTVTTYRQRIAPGASYAEMGDNLGGGKWVIESQVREQSSCAKEVQWVVATLPSCKQKGRSYNPNTGELDETLEWVVPNAQIPDTIRALNEGPVTVSVVAGAGGNSGANGDFTFVNPEFLNGDFYFVWEDPSWKLYESAVSGVINFGTDDLLQTGTGGDASGPGTATWSNYTVTDGPAPPIGSLNESGFYAVDRPLNCHFSLITMQRASPFVSRSYQTYQNYSWPNVLEDIEMMDWLRQDGASDTYPRIIWKRNAYSGPCRALITESWSRDPLPLDTVSRLNPQSVAYACPAYRITVPPSLHPAITFQCDFGTTHTVYDFNTGSSRTLPATDDLDWPSSLVVSCTQQPYRGGYLKRTIRVYQPD